MHVITTVHFSKIQCCQLRTLLVTRRILSINAISYMYSETCVLRTPQDQPKYPDCQGVLIFQVSLQTKRYLLTISKCSDCTGVLIFKCPD